MGPNGRGVTVGTSGHKRKIETLEKKITGKDQTGATGLVWGTLCFGETAGGESIKSHADVARGMVWVNS